MYRLKLFPIVLILALSSSPLRAQAEKSEVLFTVPEFPPWMYQEEGVHKGVVAAIFPVLAKLIGVEHYQYVSTDGAIARLVDHARSGQTDIVLVPQFLLPSRSDHEFYSVNNCDQILASIDYASVGVRGKVNSEQFLKDRSKYDFLVRPLLPANVRQRIVGGGSFEVSSGSSYSFLKRLMAGRVDIIADDAGTIFGAAKELGVIDSLEILERHFVTKLAMCINTRFINAQGPEFLQNLSVAVEALAKDNELELQLKNVLGDTTIYTFGDRDNALTNTTF